MWNQKYTLKETEYLLSRKLDFESFFYDINKRVDLQSINIIPLHKLFDINSSSDSQQSFKHSLNQYLISNLRSIGFRYYEFEKEFEVFFNKYIFAKRIKDEIYTEYYLNFPSNKPVLIGITFENLKVVKPLVLNY